MPMIVFQVFISRKWGKGGRRADGSSAADGADWGRARGRNGQMRHGGAGWAHWWARMERRMEDCSGGRFCRRGPLPMIERSWGGRRGRPETGPTRGRIGSLGPLPVGFPGPGGLQTGAGTQSGASCSHCSTVVLWWQVPAAGTRNDPGARKPVETG